MANNIKDKIEEFFEEKKNEDDIESGIQKDVKPDDDGNVKVNKQDDHESDKQVDNKSNEYGDDISEFSDFSTEEHSYVEMLSKEQQNLLNKLNEEFETNYEIVYKKLIFKNKVNSKAGLIAMTNEVSRYRVLRDRLRNCASNVDALVQELEDTMDNLKNL
uniref:Biogenesis of lysosome-related organelles complex 1 subunit 2 n=1 Tax=Strongyloides papillosus TaxID=174720 RepID=A0A0N5C636_STREA